MLMNEVREQTRLSRKAIEYYEEKGLISPLRDDNNYRIYSVEDVETLKKISIYRKLGCSIEKIKEILNSNDKGKLSEVIRKKEINSILENKKIEILKTLMKDGNIESVEEELNWIEKQETIYSKLMQIFPGYIGQAFFMAYKPFFTEQLKKENEVYFDEYVYFLDNLPEFPFTKEEKELMEQVSESITLADLEIVNEAKIEAVEDYDKWFEENKDLILKYIDYKQSDDYINNPIVKVQEKVRQYMEKNKYYDTAIPLIRKFSPAYDAYYEKMLKANEKLLNQNN